MTGSGKPKKKSKAELEQMIQDNGGTIFQNHIRPGTICIGGNSTTMYLLDLCWMLICADAILVASAKKRDDVDIVKPTWLFDNMMQSQADWNKSNLILRLEPEYARGLTI